MCLMHNIWWVCVSPISFTLGSVSTAFLVVILAFLAKTAKTAKTWAEKRIEFSIKHVYDKKLVEFQNDVEIRLKAELIAELMAEWLKKPKQKDRLNRLAFQAFLWLPPHLARDLASTLMLEAKSDDVPTIIQKVRKHLLGQADDLDSRSIIFFREDDENTQQSGG